MDQNIHLGKINRKNIEANFTGGDLTSDVGLLALRNIEEKTKSFNNFEQYLKFFKTKGVIIDHEKRKDFINSELIFLKN